MAQKSQKRLLFINLAVIFTILAVAIVVVREFMQGNWKIVLLVALICFVVLSVTMIIMAMIKHFDCLKELKAKVKDTEKE